MSPYRVPPRLLGAALAACLWSLPALSGSQEPEVPSRTAVPGSRSTLSDRELAWHALSRLGYGPRPGEVDQVLAQGVDRFIERQLAGTSGPEPRLQARVQQLETLGMGPDQLFEAFPFDKDERKAAKADRRRSATEARSPDSGLERLDPLRRIVAERTMARVLGAVHSERQLEEVMVDFWFNHFNVYARKGKLMPYLLGAHEDALREHAFGKFEDLLLASAKSPAMLFYLDNWLSVDEDAAARMQWRRDGRRGFLGLQSGKAKKGKGGGLLRGAKGLNENYARELLELHTLGVDGGYSQEDVQEVARCFTGWSLRRPEDGRSFVFRGELHASGSKLVLGRRIASGGGMSDGLEVLRLLARHPATASHISRKLAVRFVADEPPAALVEALTQRYLQTGGDVRELLRLLFSSPEFRSRAAFQTKVKTPFEFVASALRSTGSELGPDAAGIVKTLHEMGHAPYLCQPPTGYPQVASAWASPGGMLARMNFATRLAAGRIAGVESEIPRRSGVEDLARRLLGFEPAAEMLRIVEESADGRRARMLAAALILGGPDFQKR